MKEPRVEGYEGDDSDEESPAKPMSSRPSRSDDLIGFTPGAVAVFSQNLVFQRLEEIKQLENAFAVLKENNPAKKHLRETINHLKKEVEDLKAEKAKSKPAQGRKHSARQESDKKVAGGRVAYIKEKQRRRAAKARAEGVKERAKRRLANEEKKPMRMSSTKRAEDVRGTRFLCQLAGLQRIKKQFL